MQDLIRHLPAVVYEYAFYPDGRHHFRYVSERSCDILGLTSAQLMHDKGLLYSVVLPGDHHELDRVFRPGKRSGVGVAVVRLQREGALRKIEIRYSDETDGNGIIIRRGLIQEGDDIPDRERKEAGYPFAELFEKLPIGVVIHREGNILYANTHAHGVVGAKAGQLVGMNALNFVHPDYSSGIGDRIRRVIAGKPVPMVEEKFVCLDGRVIDVETMALPFSYNGNAAVQVIFRDVTEKKQTEAKVRRNEKLFAQLFQNVPMAVVMLDENGKVAQINHGFEQMFGYEKGELRGKNLNDFIVPEDLRSEGIDLNNLITSNRVVSIESIRRHKSGNLINVILCGVPVILDNEVIGIYGVYVDITDRKKVEEELKVRNAELDNFVYKVSHDLRAPLSSVLGLVHLSKLQGNTDNPLEYIELIGEKIQALDNFISDVLSHSKNLKMEMSIGNVELQAIIEQTFTDLSYLKGTRETKRSIKIEGIDFYSDYWRVSEIFRNLVSNAIKYRRTDAVDSEIVIKINVDHLCADITFADNGIGIKDTSLKRIFEMFYRATDQSDGSGIGLYIVKNAVEKLGGQIKVASKPGEGTRFHILLPNRINNVIDTPQTSQPG
ncbi:MAG: PAS domain-containing sensor histidine kinase [Bacteroidota bacterium]|nr:PAS domain-containing sensor histidine kinase [Bacteroidota bacterium]